MIKYICETLQCDSIDRDLRSLVKLGNTLRYHANNGKEIVKIAIFWVH